jgi:hypothetical protein
VQCQSRADSCWEGSAAGAGPPGPGVLVLLGAVCRGEAAEHDALEQDLRGGGGGGVEGSVTLPDGFEGSVTLPVAALLPE